MTIKDALIGVFTDDPVNWIKWGIVFAILIGGYVIAIPLYGKISSRLSWERKRDIARSRDHIIKAALIRKHPKGESGKYSWNAAYRYEFQGEEKNITHISKSRPDRPSICICTIWTIPASCFRLRNTIMRTIRRSFFCL